MKKIITLYPGKPFCSATSRCMMCVNLNQAFFFNSLSTTKGHVRGELKRITYLPIMFEFIKGVGDNPSWDTNRLSLK